MTAINKTIKGLFIFSVAMGFLETAVVVYLRELYYPAGFTFPLHNMSMAIIKTELLREAATIIMLYMIGHLTAKTKVQRFSYFIFCFAVWDIFYYVFLKVLLNWPASVFDWDILFLIPLPWVGPVLAPVIVSLSMILWALIIEYYSASENVSIKGLQWTLFATGSVIVIISFIKDYLAEAFRGTDVLQFGLTHLPAHYDWWIFAIGQSIMLYSILIQNNFIKRFIKG